MEEEMIAPETEVMSREEAVAEMGEEKVAEIEATAEEVPAEEATPEVAE